MRFKADSATLFTSVARAARAVESRGGVLPILSGVHLSVKGSVLTITGSDLDISIQSICSVNGTEDGVVVVPAKLLSDVTRACPAGAVTVETTSGDEVSICAGRACFTLRCIPPDEWPKMPKAGVEGVTVDAAVFGDAVSRVAVAASSDQSRSVILTAVLLSTEGEGLRMVATDSYRLHVCDLPGTSIGLDHSVLVPASILKEVAKAIPSGNMTVAFSDRLVEFRTDGLTIVSRLIEGDYPNYRALVPDSQPSRLSVNRDEFTDVIKRMSVLARDSNPLRIDCGKDVNVGAAAQDVGSASSTIDADFTGEPLTLAFNPDYLAAAVNACDGDMIEVGITDALKPAIVRSPSDPNFFCLAMPVRIS